MLRQKRTKEKVRELDQTFEQEWNYCEVCKTDKSGTRTLVDGEDVTECIKCGWPYPPPPWSDSDFDYEDFLKDLKAKDIKNGRRVFKTAQTMT